MNGPALQKDIISISNGRKIRKTHKTSKQRRKEYSGAGKAKGRPGGEERELFISPQLPGLTGRKRNCPLGRELYMG